MKSVKEEAKVLEQQHKELEARVEMYQRGVQLLGKVHENLIQEHVKKEQMILQLEEGEGGTGIAVRGRAGDGEKVDGAGGHRSADDQNEKEAVLVGNALKKERKEKEQGEEMEPADTQTIHGTIHEDDSGLGGQTKL